MSTTPSGIGALASQSAKFRQDAACLLRWSLRCAFRRERIAGAATAALIFREHAELDELGDVAQGGVGRALLSLRVFRGSELPFEPVEQAVEDVALPVIERDAAVTLPELRLAEHGGENPFRAVEGAIKTGEEPAQPRRDFKITFLRRLQHTVIVLALLPDLCRHAVKSLRTLFRTRKLHIGDGAGDTAVTVLEGVDGDEPQMRNAGLEDWP